MNHFIFRRSHVIGYAVALVIISFFAWYTYYNMGKAEAEGRHEEEVLKSLRSVEIVLDDIQDMESGHRGYVISGQTLYLEAFQNALLRITTDTTNLKDVNSGEEIKAMTDQLLWMIRQKISYLLETLRLREAGRYDLAVSRMQSDTARGLMENIRDLVVKIENRERITLAAFGETRKKAARETTILFLVLSAFFLLFLISFFLLERREIKRRFRHEVAKEVDRGLIDFRDILDRINDGFIALDKDWNYVYVNQKACQIMGKSREELLGRNMWELYQVEVNNEFFDAYRKAMTTQQYVFLEASYAEWGRWFENHIYPSPRGISIYFKDITERKKAETKLAQVNEKLKTVAKATTDVLWDADLVENTLWLNDNFYEKFGYTEAAQFSESNAWEDYLHPDDKQRVLSKIFHLMHNTRESVWTDDYRFRKSDGTYLNIYDRCYILRDKNGMPTRLIGSMTDVTSLFQARKELQRKEEQYKTLVEQATDGIFIADLTGKFIVVNSSGCALSQYSLDELTGMTIFDLADPIDVANRPFQFELLAREGGSITERKLKKKDGSVIDVEVNAKLLSDGRFLAFIRDITERKKTENAILKANERFELIARTTNEALWEWEFETGEAWANDMHQQLYGLGPGDPVPDHEDWRERIHPEDRERVIQSYRAALDSGETVWLSEYRFLSDNGHSMTIYDRTYIQRDETGKPVRMMGSMMDITGLKKAEQEIVKGKELAEKLIDSLPGVFYFYDGEGKFIRWNNQFEIVTGYRADEITSMHPTDFFADEDREYIARRIGAVFEKGVNDAEAMFLTKKGEKIPYYFKALLINYEGQPCLLGTGIDISERKKVEEELRLSEKKYRSLVEQAADAIFIFNDSGAFVDANPVSTKLLGYTLDEIVSMSLPDILFEEDLEADPIHFDALRKGDSVINRRRFRRKDGSGVPVEVHSRRMPDGRYLGIVRDLSERIEADRQLEESYRQVRELTDHLQHIREEERSHIAREIHDELGQQLTVLKMDVSWLNKRIGPGDEDIGLKLKNLAAMLDGTVKTVRRISSELRPSLLDDLGLVAAMDWHLKEFESRSGVRTEFTEPTKDLQMSETVKTGLFRIFQESLTNVARHADAGNVKVDLHQQNGNIVLRIEDDGKGFNKLQVNHKRTLGILGMKERTSMMGGSYDINSIPEKGTVVVVSVPIIN